MKQCSRCKQPKQSNEFYTNRSKKSGLTENCKECHNYILHNEFTEYRGEIMTKYQAIINGVRHYRGVDPNFNQSDFDYLLEEQDYCCAICGEYMPENQRYVDHDGSRNYQSPNVRGIVHNMCNFNMFNPYHRKWQLKMGIDDYLSSGYYIPSIKSKDVEK